MQIAPMSICSVGVGVTVGRIWWVVKAVQEQFISRLPGKLNVVQTTQTPLPQKYEVAGNGMGFAG